MCLGFEVKISIMALWVVTSHILQEITRLLNAVHITDIMFAKYPFKINFKNFGTMFPKLPQATGFFTYATRFSLEANWWQNSYQQIWWRMHHSTRTPALDKGIPLRLRQRSLPVSWLRMRPDTPAYRTGVTDIVVLRCATRRSPTTRRRPSTIETLEIMDVHSHCWIQAIIPAPMTDVSRQYSNHNDFCQSRSEVHDLIDLKIRSEPDSFKMTKLCQRQSLYESTSNNEYDCWVGKDLEGGNRRLLSRLLFHSQHKLNCFQVSLMNYLRLNSKSYIIQCVSK